MRRRCEKEARRGLREVEEVNCRRHQSGLGTRGACTSSRHEAHKEMKVSHTGN